MSEHHDGTTTLERLNPAGDAAADQGGTPPVLGWLRDEFPDWDVRIDTTADVTGATRPLWVALREGHHPQAELSAAKLHSRLSDYLDREGRRSASRN
jgi:hypothetical protein